MLKYILGAVCILVSFESAFAKGDAKKGKVQFDNFCVACHQADGKGKAGTAPRLNTPDLLAVASDEFLRVSILEGRPGTAMMGYKVMPPVKNSVEDIIAYMRSWEDSYNNFKKVKVDWKKKIKGNIAQGKTGFRRYCSFCHGPNGGGYADGGSGLAIGLSGFLKAASDDFIKKTIEIGRTGTAMKPFGHGRGLAAINDKEINNIVAYLRSLEK